MSKKIKRLNLILTLIAFGLLLLLLIFNRQALRDTYETLLQVDPRQLLILPALLLVSHTAIASCYRSVFKIYGYPVPLKRTLPMVWALNFVNQILPSGGLSGLSYLMYGLRGYVPSSKAALAQLARYVLSYFSYALVLSLAFIFLVVGNDVTRRSIVAAIWLVGISIVLLLALLLVGSTVKRVRAIIRWIGRETDRVVLFFSRGKTTGVGRKVRQTLNGFYKDYRKLLRRRSKLTAPFLFMVVSTTFEILVVVASFYIVGASINPGIIMISFAIANGIGVISVVPGDVGVHEAAMVVSLSAAGVPSGVALSGVLLYRVFNKMVFLPLGFVSYSRLLKPYIPKGN